MTGGWIATSFVPRGGRPRRRHDGQAAAGSAIGQGSRLRGGRGGQEAGQTALELRGRESNAVCRLFGYVRLPDRFDGFVSSETGLRAAPPVRTKRGPGSQIT